MSKQATIDCEEILGTSLTPAEQKRVKAAYVHRSTKDHKPVWANNQAGYRPQFASDEDWLANTFFPVGKTGRLISGECFSSPTWPDGKPDLAPAVANRKDTKRLTLKQVIKDGESDSDFQYSARLQEFSKKIEGQRDQLLEALEALVIHCAHYAAFHKAHPSAHRDVANARLAIKKATGD